MSNLTNNLCFDGRSMNPAPLQSELHGRVLCITLHVCGNDYAA